MKFRPLATLALALALPFAVVACSDGDDTNSGERPSVEEIAAGLKQAIPNGTSAPDELITCIATELEQSDLPNGVLRAAAEGRDAEVKEENEGDYTEIITNASNTCAQSAMTDLSIPDSGS